MPAVSPTQMVKRHQQRVRRSSLQLVLKAPETRVQIEDPDEDLGEDTEASIELGSTFMNMEHSERDQDEVSSLSVELGTEVLVEVHNEHDQVHFEDETSL